MPNVPVRLARYAPCDPASRELPEGIPEVGHWTGSTDADGRSAFPVPVGCYHFGMTPPPGSDPVPEGMHTLFVTTDGESVTGSLRFQNPAPTSDCDPRSIAGDLDLADYQRNATATVRECDGTWAVIAWEVPGDSQRIVRRAAAGWTTYVIFPHNRCWTQAKTDGAPEMLERYFTAC
ncbi:hypothetical protein [Nocardia asteroides]|uniref:hypothetical protein n=1 Tax=Nocardia asteroides TaxID=1824 RepID=UPI001E2F29C0|nr:hypothetical protein [Nocardia asteroides]UGT61544.1 hypothetical protein LTT61_31265 [Nocardia asteroides]